MEKKVIQAIKLLSAADNKLSLKDYHQLCVDICNLGLTEQTLRQLVDSIKHSGPAEMINGNIGAAADHLLNFLLPNPNVDYCYEFTYLVNDFVKYYENNE